MDLRGDGSLNILSSGSGSQTAVVPPPPDFLAVIFGGNNPYTWAAVYSAPRGVYYVNNLAQASGLGWTADIPITTINAATWSSSSGGQATFTYDPANGAGANYSPSAMDYVRVLGVNPSGYDGLFVVVSTGVNSFTVALVNNPGTYVTGGATCLFEPTELQFDVATVSWSSGSGGQASYTLTGSLGLTSSDYVQISDVYPDEYNGVFQVVSNAGTNLVVAMPSNPGAYQYGGVAQGQLTFTDFRAAYSNVNDPNVPAGAVVRLRPRYLNTDGTDTEMEITCPDLVVPGRYTNPGVLNANGFYDVRVQAWSDNYQKFEDGESIEVVPS